MSATARIGAAVKAGVFAPEDLAVLRASFDRAWNVVPPEGRIPENMDVMAAAIMRAATSGERDPIRLSGHALEAITPGAATALRYASFGSQ
jgi:hypothetical protein